MAKKIYFRADADSQIGYGHFIRSLALADMLKDDFDCVFFTKLPTNYQQEEVAKVCKLVELPDNDDRFDLFIDMLCGDEIVVLDNYFYTIDYQCKIKAKGCKLVCIDDFQDKAISCDLLINTSVAELTDLPLVNATNKLLGLKWSLLRKEFRQNNCLLSRTLKRAMICFGGADILNLTQKAISVVAGISDVRYIDVVVGGAKNKEDYLLDDRIFVYQGLSALEMSDLLCKSDFCIVSTSGIALEAVALGCKVFSGYYVDNQLNLYNNLLLNNYIYGLGDLRINDIVLDFNQVQLNRLNLLNQQSEYIKIFQSL
ncbi:MAG: UDP-2,4-diacetamido-2,4,6-trideoxy-beta-L-altropyranose hydrolase [Paludibacteraceae bacterium]|nr:UDP-2,4-diacetamido-2,4,6-trideoxy-beta-L-altropyranose hydrolase [Paludibacteraceae bacterium]